MLVHWLYIRRTSRDGRSRQGKRGVALAWHNWLLPLAAVRVPASVTTVSTQRARGHLARNYVTTAAALRKIDAPAETWFHFRSRLSVLRKQCRNFHLISTWWDLMHYMLITSINKSRLLTTRETWWITSSQTTRTRLLFARLCYCSRDSRVLPQVTQPSLALWHVSHTPFAGENHGKESVYLKTLRICPNVGLKWNSCRRLGEHVNNSIFRREIDEVKEARLALPFLKAVKEKSPVLELKFLCCCFRLGWLTANDQTSTWVDPNTHQNGHVIVSIDNKTRLFTISERHYQNNWTKFGVTC